MSKPTSSPLRWHSHPVTQTQRAQHKQQKPCVIWFTGLSGAGKSTLAGLLEQQLFERGQHTYLLDGDNVRQGINQDLGFSDADRSENIRRIGEMSKLFVDAGLMVMVAFISPSQQERQAVRARFNRDEFFEIYLSTSLQACEQRDPKGLYKRARAGEIKQFTGIDSHYQPPQNPELSLDTSELTPQQCVDAIMQLLIERGILKPLIASNR